MIREKKNQRGRSACRQRKIVRCSHDLPEHICPACNQDDRPVYVPAIKKGGPR